MPGWSFLSKLVSKANNPKPLAVVMIAIMAATEIAMMMHTINNIPADEYSIGMPLISGLEGLVIGIIADLLYFAGMRLANYLFFKPTLSTAP